MPRDRSESVMPWNAVVLWLGLCLGTGTIGIGCLPATPKATPRHLKLMQAKGRALLKSKTAEKLSPPAPPKTISPRTNRSGINANPFLTSPGPSSLLDSQAVYRSLNPC